MTAEGKEFRSSKLASTFLLGLEQLFLPYRQLVGTQTERRGSQCQLKVNSGLTEAVEKKIIIFRSKNNTKHDVFNRYTFL